MNNRPNMLFIIADQLRADFVGCYGASFVKTPNIDALAAQGLVENTVIIFTSDHGDYLDDHDFIGKGIYYESAIHVPLIVRVPGGEASVYDGLVELTDITATLLALVEAKPPQPMDSRPLPALGLVSQPRSIIFGLVSNGWMAYDGRWKQLL